MDVPQIALPSLNNAFMHKFEPENKWLRPRHESSAWKCSNHVFRIENQSLRSTACDACVVASSLSLGHRICGLRLPSLWSRINTTANAPATNTLDKYRLFYSPPPSPYPSSYAHNDDARHDSRDAVTRDSHRLGCTARASLRSRSLRPSGKGDTETSCRCALGTE